MVIRRNEQAIAANKFWFKVVAFVKGVSKLTGTIVIVLPLLVAGWCSSSSVSSAAAAGWYFWCLLALLAS